MVSSNRPDATPEGASDTLVDQVIAEYKAALLETKEFDEDTANAIVAVAKGPTKPKAKEIEKALDKEESLG